MSEKYIPTTKGKRNADQTMDDAQWEASEDREAAFNAGRQEVLNGSYGSAIEHDPTPENNPEKSLMGKFVAGKYYSGRVERDEKLGFLIYSTDPGNKCGRSNAFDDLPEYVMRRINDNDEVTIIRSDIDQRLEGVVVNGEIIFNENLDD
jgi:hypothetical protein